MIVKKNSIKLIFLGLMLITGTAYSQLQPACPNANFAQGGFNNWTGFTGDYTNPFALPGIVSGRHTIISTPGIDPYSCGGLQLLPPGSFVVARIGNNGTSAEAEALRYAM